MVKLKVYYKNGKDYDVDCYRFDAESNSTHILIYSDKSTVSSKLTKSRIEKFEVVK